MFPNLMLAVLSSMVPGFGLLANIVEFITSDDPNAGKRFVFEIVTSGLPGGVLTSLATELAGELLFGDQVSYAVTQVTPYNDLTLPCGNCHKFSHYYVKQAGRIICSDCLSREIGTRVYSSDKLYLLKGNVRHLHSELKRANYLYGQSLRANNLTGKQLKGRNL